MSADICAVMGDAHKFYERLPDTDITAAVSVAWGMLQAVAQCDCGQQRTYHHVDIDGVMAEIWYCRRCQKAWRYSGEAAE